MSNIPTGADQDARAPWKETRNSEEVEFDNIERTGDGYVEATYCSSKKGSQTVTIDEEDLLEFILKYKDKL